MKYENLTNLLPLTLPDSEPNREEITIITADQGCKIGKPFSSVVVNENEINAEPIFCCPLSGWSFCLTHSKLKLRLIYLVGFGFHCFGKGPNFITMGNLLCHHRRRFGKRYSHVFHLKGIGNSLQVQQSTIILVVLQVEQVSK